MKKKLKGRETAGQAHDAQAINDGRNDERPDGTGDQQVQHRIRTVMATTGFCECDR